MSRILVDERTVASRPDAIWELLQDPAALARVIPGTETIRSAGDWRYEGVMASRIQFMTVRADVEATVTDRRPPAHFRLELRGRPHGLAGTFTVSIDVYLLEMTGTDPTTQIGYVVDLAVTGRLAAFGAPILRDTMRRQVDALFANVERELGSSS